MNDLGDNRTPSSAEKKSKPAHDESLKNKSAAGVVAGESGGKCSGEIGGGGGQGGGEGERGGGGGGGGGGEGGSSTSSDEKNPSSDSDKRSKSSANTSDGSKVKSKLKPARKCGRKRCKPVAMRNKSNTVNIPRTSSTAPKKRRPSSMFDRQISDSSEDESNYKECTSTLCKQKRKKQFDSSPNNPTSNPSSSNTSNRESSEQSIKFPTAKIASVYIKINDHSGLVSGSEIDIPRSYPRSSDSRSHSDEDLLSDD